MRRLEIAGLSGKAIRASDFPEEAWVVLGGDGSGESRELIELYEAVDYLYRGITIRAQKLASIPFVIKRKGQVFYDSEENQDEPPIGFEWLNKLPVVLEMIEAATSLTGRAYVYPIVNDFNFVMDLQWFKPTSVSPHYHPTTGDLEYFRRRRPDGEKKVDPDDLIYFWPPDPTVEIGPARRFPGRAAMKAAGVLANMDDFLEHYFGRGAIKVTLLTTEGVVGANQRDLLKTWWQKVASGVKNAFTTEVVNAKKVTPVVIGEGVKDLENTALTNEKREAICAALGVPPSKVIPSAANYATKQSDDVMLVSDTIVPELRWITAVLNDQLFSRWSMSIQFRPESLPEMQTDEASRAQSLSLLVNAGMPLLMGLDTLGYDIDEKWVAKLEEMERQKEEMREAGAEALAQGGQGQPPPAQGGDDEAPPGRHIVMAKKLEEAQRFERWLKNDPTRSIADFASDVLTADDLERIKAIVDGKLIPVGSPVHVPLETPAELADPSDLARLVRDVEKWAEQNGLDLDKILNAEEQPREAGHDNT